MYLALKIVLFMSILRAFIKFEPLQKYAIFLAVLYTAIVAGLSWVFFIAPQVSLHRTLEWRGWEMRLVVLLLPKSQWSAASIGWRAWQLWLVETFLLMVVYLRLLAKFEDGTIYWVILIAGLGLILF